MIKKSTIAGKHLMVCDSCHVVIGHCVDFKFNDGQELKYSPILCEKCGTQKNKEIGKNIKQIQALEKTLRDLIADPKMKDSQGIIGWTYLQNGIKNLDFFSEK